MKCPKCSGDLKAGKSKNDIPYRWCSSCKGLWISSRRVYQLIKNKEFLKEFQRNGLLYKRKTNYNCPKCSTKLSSGRVFDKKLLLDECEKCKYIFFDNKEINKLYEISKDYKLSDKRIERLVNRINMIEVNKSSKKCPLCKDQYLFEIYKKSKKVLVCKSCNGVFTSVENLENIAKKSLFNLRMFNFREGYGAYSICRYCYEEQDPANKKCQKCKKPMRKIKCLKCSSTMGDFTLHEILIERCQFCNSVWLDKGEFEKVISAMPDIRREYERTKREAELFRTLIRAKNEILLSQLTQERRRLIRENWGPIGVFLFDY